MNKIVKVLVVDDSAYIRKVVRQMLSRSPFIEVVGIARDGHEALELVQELRPDVVTLDLMMPNLDGVGFLREQMSRKPVPTVIVSIAEESGETALEAFDAGAVDFVQKPTALATARVLDIADELIAKVKEAATANVTAALPSNGAASASVSQLARKRDAVVIGVSTGGPQALKRLIPALPKDFPVPILVVLHMPIGYTQMYAQRLNDVSHLTVVEAADGDEIKVGHVFIAPAGRHLKLRRQGDRVFAELSSNPVDTLHTPSVDVLFQSASEVYGDRALGIVMTGMGSDGQKGAAWIKAKGGMVMTEHEQSCVVYGMPRSVAEAGLSDRSVPLDRLAASIAEEV